MRKEKKSEHCSYGRLTMDRQSCTFVGTRRRSHWKITDDSLLVSLKGQKDGKILDTTRESGKSGKTRTCTPLRGKALMLFCGTPEEKKKSIEQGKRRS